MYRSVRPNRIRRYLANSRDTLECACVGDSLGELLAEGLEALFGGHSEQYRTEIALLLYVVLCSRCSIRENKKEDYPG